MRICTAMTPRITVYFSDDIEAELAKLQKEHGQDRIQDAVRTVLSEWYKSRTAEKASK